MEARVIELRENEHIRIQQENCGYEIKGPIKLILLEEEKNYYDPTRKVIGSGLYPFVNPTSQFFGVADVTAKIFRNFDNK